MKNFMDTALELRIKFENNEPLTEDEIKNFLEKSFLLKKLTSDFSDEPLFLVWRVIALSEIPHSNKLEYTQNIIRKILHKMGTAYGFILTGEADYLLPCYNAMLISALCKLGLPENEIVKNGISWIMEYQVFARNKVCNWRGTGIKKYGGCFKTVPCYIGLAKALKALINYNKYHRKNLIQNKIDIGIEYLLKHHLYKRLSNGEPITKHILDIAFPESYNLNIVELLDIVYSAGKINDERVNEAVDYLNSKRQKNGGWKTNYVYKSKGYVSFDARGQIGEWVTYLLEKILSKNK
ncbi:hypothetical protein NO1_2174 [Candidatus Termititenax aidoneus]|uniref:Uncharacterized protein n=1 Tax=Termititenax aidoneus TaxID=2218524 RepID=A0A388TEP0_TERA1|nr:hypothetical protein NO1_2174 [Candidatus Termititenax aidoneus]